MPFRYCRLPVGGGTGHGKAVDTCRQGHAGLRRSRPDVAGDFHGIWIVITTPRDSPNVGPSGKGQRNSGAAIRTKMDEDALVAAVRDVFITTKRPVVEIHRVHWEHGFSIKRRSRHPLAKGAMAGQGAQRHLFRAKPHTATKAAAGQDVSQRVHVGLVEVPPAVIALTLRPPLRAFSPFPGNHASGPVAGAWYLCGL